MNKPFVYFGTPYVSRDTLALLKTHGLIPVLIVTAPDSPRGRGLTMTSTETKEWALQHNIPVFTPPTIDTDAIQKITSYGCGFAIVVAYGKILPQALIDVFPQGILNIHYSLLPKYRGASPVEAALLNGDTTTGVSIQRMVYELDAGDIIAQEETVIGPVETTVELRARLITIGANLLATILPHYLMGSITPTPQDASLATRCRKIKKEDGYIKLGTDDTVSWNKFRAYAQWPRTSFEAERSGQTMRITVITAHMENGVFVPDTVKPAGKNEMPYKAFLLSGARPV